MPQAAARLKPKVTSYNHKLGMGVYELVVPYSANQESWAGRVQKLAPLTRPDHFVLDRDDFRRPAATQAPFTLTLVEMCRSMDRSAFCLRFAKQNGLYLASAYHLLDALEYAGDLRQSISWWGLHAGPGILATDPGAVPEMNGDPSYFCVWYPAAKSPCQATTKGHYELLAALTLFAFVKEPWQTAAKQQAA